MPTPMHDATEPRHVPLVGESETDVVVIGAGLTGLYLALLLVRGGLRVVVLEAGTVGSGTTGSTSGHLCALPDLDLVSLRRKHGDAVVQRTIEAGQRAIRGLATLSDEERADAFRPAAAWQYAESQDQRVALDAQVACLEGLGVPHTLGVPPVPFPTIGGFRLADQGMLDPVAMMRALLRACVRHGVRVCEGSRVLTCEDGAPCVVQTDTAVLRAREVVQATHTPIGLMASLQTRMKAMASHVIRVRLAGPLEMGLFYDLADPYHYLRPLGPERPDVWLVGGADDTMGARRSVAESFDELERYARERLPVTEVEARGMHGFFEPVDGLPYIGLPVGTSHVQVITGLSGTGLTWGPAAAEAIADRLLARVGAPGEALLEDWAAGRMAAVAGASRMIANNLDVVFRFLADRLGPNGDLHPTDLRPGEGRLVQDGVRTVAVWRDPAGELHALSPVCTHLGCIVQWNDAAGTWDCPCHGGRFQADGTVAYGPPTADLARRRL